MSSSNSPFFINQRIEIAFEKSTEYFPSRIEDFSENKIIIAMPMRSSVPIIMPRNTPLYGRAVASEGIRYSFKSQLIDWSQKPLPVLIVERPENVIKIQQRNFFRYNITIPIKYYLLDDNDFPIEESQTAISTKNLSAGGVLIISNKQPLPVKTKLWLEMPLAQNEVVKVYAKVTRTNLKNHPNGGKIFFTAIKFFQIEEIDKRKIINFLNSKLLENRHRAIF